MSTPNLTSMITDVLLMANDINQVRYTNDLPYLAINQGIRTVILQLIQDKKFDAIEPFILTQTLAIAPSATYPYSGSLNADCLYALSATVDGVATSIKRGPPEVTAIAKLRPRVFITESLIYIPYASSSAHGVVIRYVSFLGYNSSSATDIPIGFYNQFRDQVLDIAQKYLAQIEATEV